MARLGGYGLLRRRLHGPLHPSWPTSVFLSPRRIKLHAAKSWSLQLNVECYWAFLVHQLGETAVERPAAGLGCALLFIAAMYALQLPTGWGARVSSRVVAVAAASATCAAPARLRGPSGPNWPTSTRVLPTTAQRLRPPQAYAWYSIALSRCRVGTKAAVPGRARIRALCSPIGPTRRCAAAPRPT